MAAKQWLREKKGTRCTFHCG